MIPAFVVLVCAANSGEKGMTRICIVLFILLVPGICYSQGNESVFKKGSTIILPAKSGTDELDLGKGFSSDFKIIDDAGPIPRAYKSDHIDKKDNRYDTRIEILETGFELNAHVSSSFSSLNVKAKTDSRYAVFRAFHIDSVKELKLEGENNSRAPVVSTRIYYGWALFAVIEGSSKFFSAHVAAKLLGTGADISAIAKQNNLKTRVSTIGLSTKTSGEIPLVTSIDKIKTTFVPSEKPQPIFVEYLAVKNIPTYRIDFMKGQGLLPGKYKFYIEDLEVMEKTLKGKSWDALGGKPDPIVRVMVNKTNFGVVAEKDTFKPKCNDLNGKIVNIDNSTILYIEVMDKDVIKSNLIGKTKEVILIGHGKENSPFDMPLAKGSQIKKILIRLVKIE